MVKLQKLMEITDELMEQVVLTFYPEANIYKETKEGQLDIKKKYGDVRLRIYTILKNDLNGG